MNKIWIGLVLIFVVSCDSQSKKVLGDSVSIERNDTTKHRKMAEQAYSKAAVDSLIRAGVISADDVDLPPTQSEERAKLQSRYNKTETIDSAVVTPSLDTLHLYVKYYCLKNVALVVSSNYNIDNKEPKEFVTHPFVTYVRLIHNSDTVLNRVFQASDFNPYFTDNFGGNLKKSGSILMLPEFPRMNRDKNKIELIYSISIPTTDIGIGMFLTLSKDGRFKITENR